MALIKCPECGKEISDKAPACIYCGCPASAMKTEPVKPAPTVSLNELFGDCFGGQSASRPVQTAPLKTVPKELPNPKPLTAAVVAVLDKACGVCGFAGFAALVAVVVTYLDSGYFEEDILPVSFLCMAGAVILAALIDGMEFRRARKFLRKNGYEESIRRDSTAMTNTYNAFGLCRTMQMVRYIKSLNPINGSKLSAQVKRARAEKWKKRLGYLPFLAVLGAVYYVLPDLLLDEIMYLIVAHIVTLVVTAVYGFINNAANGLAVTAAVVFAPAVMANYYEDMWYHILICAGVAFVGMYIGASLRKKK